MNKILRHEYPIMATVDDFDFCDRIKPSAVLQHFQDIATEHANILNIGYERLSAKNYFWVLTKVAAEVDKQPLMCEKLRMVTYPRHASAVEAIRDYYIFNSKDEIIIRGSSKWCVLDATHRRIRRIAEIFDYTDDYYRPDDAVEGGCRRLIVPEEGAELGVFKVKITDLDRNRHMNNAKYGDIALDFEDIDYLQKHRIRRFDINFLNEMPYNAEARIVRAGEGLDRVYHGVKADGKSAYIMLAEWVKC